MNNVYCEVHVIPTTVVYNYMQSIQSVLLLLYVGIIVLLVSCGA